MSKRVELHRKLCKQMTDIYERKNHDYGGSFTSTRKEYDNSILIRIHDKYSRLKTLKSKEVAQKVSDESIKDTLMDLANYCILELIEMEMDEIESK